MEYINRIENLLLKNFFKKSTKEEKDFQKEVSSNLPEMLSIRDCDMVANFAIELAIHNHQVYVLVDNGGDISFVDEATLPVLSENTTSFIYINFYKIAKQHFEKYGGLQYDTDPLYSIIKAMIKLPRKISLDEQEIEVINLIRKKEYKQKTIWKKDNKIYTLYTDKENKSDLSDEEIIKLVHSSDYQDIVLKKRNGKLVNVSSTETHKID